MAPGAYWIMKEEEARCCLYLQLLTYLAVANAQVSRAPDAVDRGSQNTVSVSYKPGFPK